MWQIKTNANTISSKFVSSYSSSVLQQNQPELLYPDKSELILPQIFFFFDVMQFSLGNIDKDDMETLFIATESDDNAGDSVIKDYEQSFYSAYSTYHQFCEMACWG